MKTKPPEPESLEALAPHAMLLLVDLHKHIMRCAKQDRNIEHYPAEWMPLKKRLAEIVSKIN